MANTYVKIAEVSVGAGGAASIDFSSIPSTYTDLVILSSTRLDNGTDNGVRLQFNGDTGSNYSWRYLYGNGSAASSGSGSSQTYAFGAISNRSTATASTFANCLTYIPNYLASTAKSVSLDGINENNATAADAMLWASLWTGTAAVTSIKLFPSVGNFVQYSSATLYGISKSQETTMADTKVIINCETGEVTEVELTPEEIAQRKADAEAAEVAKALKEATKAELAALKQSVLDRLGITEDEAKALLA